MDVSASNITHNSTAKAIKYRQVEITPIMMDPVRREQQKQDVRNAILQILFCLVIIIHFKTQVIAQLNYLYQHFMSSRGQ